MLRGMNACRIGRLSTLPCMEGDSLCHTDQVIMRGVMAVNHKNRQDCKRLIQGTTYVAHAHHIMSCRVMFILLFCIVIGEQAIGRMLDNR